MRAFLLLMASLSIGFAQPTVKTAQKMSDIHPDFRKEMEMKFTPASSKKAPTEAEKINLSESQYQKLKAAFSYLNNERMTSEQRVACIDAARELGMFSPDGGSLNLPQITYWQAIMNGSTVEEANAIKQTALQEQAIAQQRRIAEEQTYELQKLREEVNTLRNEMPRKQVQYIQGW